ncbi:unnamed protein product [Linum trigynum]|uniref:Uncharacterized protein n=1 Tax=Linum trigynum TaxID=586398 RepID=A0AAV2CC08_9ROSI
MTKGGGRGEAVTSWRRWWWETGRREGCDDGGGGRRRPRWLRGEGRDNAGRRRTRRREGCISDERRRAWRVGRTAATTVVAADREREREEIGGRRRIGRRKMA